MVRKRLPIAEMLRSARSTPRAASSGASEAGAAGVPARGRPAPNRLVAGIELVAAGEALLAPSLTRRLRRRSTSYVRTGVGTPAALSALPTARRGRRSAPVRRRRRPDRRRRRRSARRRPVTVKTHVTRIPGQAGGGDPGAGGRAWRTVQGYRQGRGGGSSACVADALGRRPVADDTGVASAWSQRAEHGSRTVASNRFGGSWTASRPLPIARWAAA